MLKSNDITAEISRLLGRRIFGAFRTGCIWFHKDDGEKVVITREEIEDNGLANIRTLAGLEG